MNPTTDIDTGLLLKLPLTELISRANKVRQEFIGNKIELCSIVNAKSGLCPEDCKFCAQSSRHSAKVDAYQLKNKGQIVKAAHQAKEIAAERFGIVASGNRLNAKEIAEIEQAVRQIKDEVDIIICASLGALKKEDLQRLKDAGLTCYHHNIETSRRFYPQIVSTHSFDERINTIRAANEVGLEVCSGGIIGMGESWQDRIDMAYLLKELNVDSVPINFLVPIKGTPLESLELISSADALRTICIFRIILKDKVLKIAAGREIIFKDSQSSGFMAGANGMLIGGYLTIKGQGVGQDHALLEQIKRLWTE